MYEFLLQHGADVKTHDRVSYCCQLFYLSLIMVQVYVVPINLCFGSKLPDGPSCWTGSLFTEIPVHILHRPLKRI